MYWHPNALATSLAAASALVVLCAGIGHYARKRGRYTPGAVYLPFGLFRLPACYSLWDTGLA